jgi:hypothetical protein
VPLTPMAKLANIESCQRRFTVSLPSSSPKFSHMILRGLHVRELEQLGAYNNNNAQRYTKNKPAAFKCVFLASWSSAIIRKAITRPPTAIAIPRAKIESFYTPLFQILTMIFGVAAALQQRNTGSRLLFFTIFVITASIALFLCVISSTGISQRWVK